MQNLKADSNKSAESGLRTTDLGKGMDIRSVCGILSKTFSRAFQPKIMQNGFKISGIFLFDENLISDDEFLVSYSTNRSHALSILKFQINLATRT